MWISRSEFDRLSKRVEELEKAARNPVEVVVAREQAFVPPYDPFAGALGGWPSLYDTKMPLDDFAQRVLSHLGLKAVKVLAHVELRQEGCKK